MSIVIDFDDLLEDQEDDDGNVIINTTPVWSVTSDGIKVVRVVRQF